jgi:hypothetical protein
MGQKAPRTITFSTSPADAEAAIRAYNDWWNAISRKKRADEQG